MRVHITGVDFTELGLILGDIKKVWLVLESNCSDNENDSDHYAKRAHSIGWNAPHRIRHAHSTNGMRSLCAVIVIVFHYRCTGVGL